MLTTSSACCGARHEDVVHFGDSSLSVGCKSDARDALQIFPLVLALCD